MAGPTGPRPVKRGSCVITEEQLRQGSELRRQGLSRRAICKRLGVSQSTLDVNLDCFEIQENHRRFAAGLPMI
jgi:hypothetical protein